MGYKWGGDLGAMEIMDQVVERNFGAVVDYNVEINLDAFDAIINAVGYITADLDEDEAAYMNEKFKDYPDRNFKVGENRLCMAGCGGICPYAPLQQCGQRL